MAPDKKHATTTFGTVPPSLSSVQIGVWQLIWERSSAREWSLPKPSLLNLTALLESTYIPRFLVDVFHLAPILFPLYITTHVLLSINSAIQLQFMNRIFESIEQSVRIGHADITSITSALALRVGSLAFGALMRWIQERISLILKTRVSVFCRDHIIQRHLSTDLLSSSGTSIPGGDNFPSMISMSLGMIFDVFETVMSTVAQAIVVLQLLSTQENPWMLGLMCLARPLLTAISRQGIWGSNAAYYVNNVMYRRLLTMYNIATTGAHKQEIISGGLQEWILKEYRSAQKHLSNLSDKTPDSFNNRISTPAHSISLALSGDLPLAFYIITGLMNGRTVSLTFLATLQQMTSSLREAIEILTWSHTSIGECATFLEGLYARPPQPETDEKVGCEPYPPTEKHSGGMGIEFQNVIFRYPGTETTPPAVHNVSFTLPPSSLVVIVGANGSGKSSLVKLLTGLYTPASGTILIDGLDKSLYAPSALRAATALLTQDHTLFPLSLAENIGVGDPDATGDRERIKEAARLGGAKEFVARRKDGFDTVLQPLKTLEVCRYQLPSGPLKTFTEEVERQTDVSGGEKQRLAASRTFMRLMSGKVKLVVVDEPTSAMDPTGEFELFETLRSMRAGKTMVFVTHRFGHLTKHADLILCMKDGELVESGTHKALMELNGVYSELYDVQARAFADESTTS